MQHNLEAREEANEPKKRFLIQYLICFFSKKQQWVTPIFVAAVVNKS